MDINLNRHDGTEILTVPYLLEIILTLIVSRYLHLGNKSLIKDIYPILEQIGSGLGSQLKDLIDLNLSHIAIN